MVLTSNGDAAVPSLRHALVERRLREFAANRSQRVSDFGLRFTWLMSYTLDISQREERSRINTAKVFWSGRSQAIRLPKEFRFDTDEVRIRRHGAAVILEPISQDWAWLDEIVGPFDESFVAATDEEVDPQLRPGLDTFE